MVIEAVESVVLESTQGAGMQLSIIISAVKF
jgi:hypothetical protein